MIIHLTLWYFPILKWKVVAIGAPYNDGNGTNSGHVRVYRYISNSWSKVGSDIDGEQEFDGFYATNLSPDGTTLAIAAPNNDDSANNAGHVKLTVLLVKALHILLIFFQVRLKQLQILA